MIPEKTADSFFDLLGIIFCSFGGRWMALTAFVDETETFTGTQISGVAGFLYDQQNLAQLQKEWASRTSSLCKPFRTAHCNAQRGQFCRWPHDECQRLISDLSAIVGKFRGPGFVCTTEKVNFPKNQIFSKPYSACLLYLVGMAHAYLASQQIKDRVFYLIERGGNGEPEASNILRRLRRDSTLRERYQLEEYIFLGKEDSKAALLGSADLLAWQWQNNFREAEKVEQANLPNQGWGEQFKLFYPTEDSPPIVFHHLSSAGVGALAIKAGVSRLDVD